ncbi:NfeD family protein [Pseudoalteromonas sp. T1lg88]|uniref:NfeD family protein n=1 Tax=Pseudoalteromonas sp. T1lg88 TaxID=2077104 RepID=UPI000CF68503|nr:nodulation protein NfeD [Pseudoalteromonas sp. T1lg88]
MIRLLALVLLLTAFYGLAQEQTEQQPTNMVPVIRIEGAIGPAVADFVVRQINKANALSQPLLMITLDTPGGLSSSLRQINQAVLTSSVPVACLVYPQGARAASAGTFLLYACHIAAMAPATTLGAATPVNIAAPGQGQPQGEKEQTPSAMDKKMLNDAIAYIRSLAQLRGRNPEWAEQAVREAATLTASEAMKENVITHLADSPTDLLAQLEGFSIKSGEQQTKLTLAGAQLQPVEPDWRFNFIATITDPNIAYILMLIGVYGLLLEFYSPGIGVAGVVGAISLIVALYAFQMLPLSFSGLALIALGIALMVAESFVPSFGIFGLGGIAAFVLGSIFLIDTQSPYFQISIPLIAGVAFTSVLVVIFLLGYLWRNRNVEVVFGQESMAGKIAIAEKDFCGQGFVDVGGERWAAHSDSPIKQGDQVTIESVQGLTLHVSPPPAKE